MTGFHITVDQMFSQSHTKRVFRADHRLVSCYAWHYRNDPGFTLACEASLSKAERIRASALGAPGSRQAFIQRRAFKGWLLRTLGHGEWALHTPGAGWHKRSLPRGTQGQSVSVTSTDALAIMALANCERLGVDAEAPATDTDVRALAATLFTPEEHDSVQQASDNDARVLFHRLWRLKEAGLKYAGLGLAQDLNRFVFVGHGSGTLRVQSSSRTDQHVGMTTPAFFECRFMGLDLALALPATSGGAGRWQVARAIPQDPWRNGSTTNGRTASAGGRSPAPAG